MNIVTGASGRVGSALVKELTKRGMPVTAVIRDPDKAGIFGGNVQVRMADIFDADALTKAFEGGHTVFLMTPESIHSEDVIGDAGKVIGNYRKAVTEAGIKRIIGLSSMGAHIGEGSGNLYISYLLERAFAGLQVQTTFIRPAYYYSNWLGYLDVAREHGILPTFFDPAQKIAMVSPADVAQFAATVISNGTVPLPVYEITGPVDYSSDDVAQIFGKHLNRDVVAQQIPREQWIATLTSVGFSDDAARNMAAMTATLTDEEGQPKSKLPPTRLKTGLEEYLCSVKVK